MTSLTPSNPSLRQHIVDVLYKVEPAWFPDAADALLADPTLAAIIDLAAWWTTPEDIPAGVLRLGPLAPEVRALLTEWRNDV